jgi:hypothetical protein
MFEKAAKLLAGIRKRVAWIALAVLATAPPIKSQAVAYTGSFQFATGTYIFNQRTNGLSFMNGFSLSLGSLRISASIPLIYQSTPYVSYSGVGLIPSGGSEYSALKGRQGKKEVLLPEVIEYEQVGVGDPLFHADLEFIKEGKFFPSLRLSAEIKMPVTDIDSGFGTGEWDYSAGLSVSKSMGRAFIFADLIYWVLGDLVDLELKDIWSYSFALGSSLGGGKYAVIATYSGQTQVIEGLDAPAFFGIGFSYRIDSKKSLMLSGSLGLTESAPDFSLSFGWRIGF